jgi:hypothetical protein
MFVLKKRCGLQNIRLIAVCYVVVAVFAEQQAWGTCGDYLDEPHANMQNKLSLHSFQSQADEPVNTPPCSGPECRRRDSAPNPPAGIPTSIVSYDAILLEVIDATEAQAATILPRCRVAGSSVFAARVFRPPRVA